MTTITQQSSPKRRFQGSLIRSMLLVLIPLSMLPVLLMGGAAYYRSKVLLTDQVNQQLDRLEDLESTALNQLSTTQQVRLLRVIHRSEFTSLLNTILEEGQFSSNLSDNRAKLIQEFQPIANPSGSPVIFQQFIVASPDGEIQLSSNSAWEGKRLNLEDHLYQDLFAEGRSLAANAPSPLYTDQFVILSSQPVYGQNGQVIATLIGVTESAVIQNLIDPLVATQVGGYFYMVTEEGDFIGHTTRQATYNALQPNTEQQGVLEKFVQTAKARNTENFDLSTEFTSFDNSKVISVAHWLPSMEIAVVSEIPETLVFQQINSLGPFSLVLFFFTTIFLSIVIWLGTRRLIIPLQELTRSTEHFSEGDFRARSSIERNDEIGRLAYAFNNMADQLTQLYRSLEFQVEERTQQIRAAAEVAEIATSTPDLSNLLRKTVELLVDRFKNYYQVSIFLVDESKQNAVLEESFGPAGEALKARKHHLAIGSNSLVGWATAHNQPRVASDVAEDPIHFKNPLLPETRSEVAVPIAVGSTMLGALDVQSKDPSAFDESAVSVLLTLANQIAAAVQNIRLLESAQVSLEETSLLYEASHLIAQAESAPEVVRIIVNTLKKVPHINALFIPDEKGLRMVSMHTPTNEKNEKPELADRLVPVAIAKLQTLLPTDKPLLINDLTKPAAFPLPLRKLPAQLGCQSAAYLPVWRGGNLAGLVILGTAEKGILNQNSLQPYASLGEVITNTLEKIAALESGRSRVNDLEIINTISQTISTENDLSRLFRILHKEIQQVIGEETFYIALYDKENEQIEIPYLFEDGQASSLEPFPLGEGLTSIVIHSKQPLMLVEDTENKARELGAKILGKTAKSWLGVPLMISGDVIGVMTVQSTTQEHRFTDNDMRLMNAISGQIASAIHNTQLLTQTQKQAEQERTLNIITDKIRRSINIHSILETTAQELQATFGARRTDIALSIQPHDNGNNGSQEEQE